MVAEIGNVILSHNLLRDQTGFGGPVHYELASSAFDFLPFEDVGFGLEDPADGADGEFAG